MEGGEMKEGDLFKKKIKIKHYARCQSIVYPG
jgi:hypothetical protein